MRYHCRAEPIPRLLERKRHPSIKDVPFRIWLMLIGLVLAMIAVN